MKLDGKIALVTGGGRGIGRAIAERLAVDGATVVTTQRNAPENPALAYIPADFADEASTQAVVPQAIERFGGLDILVNNAGVMVEARTEAMTLADWDRVMTVNLRTPFILCQAAIPAMRKRGGGAILNLGSIEGLERRALSLQRILLP